MTKAVKGSSYNEDEDGEWLADFEAMVKAQEKEEDFDCIDTSDMPENVLLEDQILEDTTEDMMTKEDHDSFIAALKEEMSTMQSKFEDQTRCLQEDLRQERIESREKYNLFQKKKVQEQRELTTTVRHVN